MVCSFIWNYTGRRFVISLVSLLLPAIKHSLFKQNACQYTASFFCRNGKREKFFNTHKRHFHFPMKKKSYELTFTFPVIFISCSRIGKLCVEEKKERKKVSAMWKAQRMGRKMKKWSKKTRMLSKTYWRQNELLIYW